MLTLAARVRSLFELVKFAHTIFALPFALLTAFIAAGGPPTPRIIALVVLAMVAARTGAMATNRLTDQAFDAQNPRTEKRALVTGELGRGFVLAVAVTSFALVLLSAWALNPLALQLAPLAIAILVLYSYTKRFTWASHAFLGLALAGAPLGAWVAVRGTIGAPAVVLAVAVLLWVAGFDVLYACQDIYIDRRLGLHSIPARFGIERALGIAKLFHLAMVLTLLTLPLLAPLGPVFVAGVVLVGALLYYEHRLVSPKNLHRLNEAFFTVNGLVSVALLLCGVLDLTLFAP